MQPGGPPLTAREIGGGGGLAAGPATSAGPAKPDCPAPRPEASAGQRGHIILGLRCRTWAAGASRATPHGTGRGPPPARFNRARPARLRGIAQGLWWALLAQSRILQSAASGNAEQVDSRAEQNEIGGCLLRADRRAICYLAAFFSKRKEGAS